jgi:6-phosphogluconolactonase
VAREQLTAVPSAGCEWHVFASRAEPAKALAGRIADTLAAAIAKRGTGFLAVSGGSTPALFFAELSRMRIDWSKVIVTLVDERLAPPSSPRSNAGLVTGKLLQGPAAAARFVPLYHEAETVEHAAALAGEALRGLPWPLDAVVLGMGTDGHTASFFPDAGNLDALLDPASDRILSAVHAPSGIEPRLTLTLAPIAAAGFLALHIEGAEKRQVLDRALAGERLPIRAVFDHAARPVEIFWAE